MCYLRFYMKVSVIIPVFNVAPYIKACLTSVMSQTYGGSMECLIVDDCGTDDSMTIVQQMLSEYDGPIQFRILQHEKNRGLSAARNTATGAAIGEFLYYLDSDDEISCDCIEKLMDKVAEYPDVDLVQGRFCCHLLQGGEKHSLYIEEIPLADTNDSVRECYYHLGQLYVHVWNKLLRREFIMENGLFCKEGILHEDYLWSFYLVKCLKKVAFISDVTYHYKLRSTSITKGLGQERRIRSFYSIYKDVLTNLTPGYESQEFNYYVGGITTPFFSYVRIVPQFKEVLQLCLPLGRKYGSFPLRIRLNVMSFLSKFKYGRIVWKLLLRIAHPGRVLEDIRKYGHKR